MNLPCCYTDDDYDCSAVERGGRDIERWRHIQFDHLRIGAREDFRMAPELQRHMDQLREDALPSSFLT